MVLALGILVLAVVCATCIITLIRISVNGSSRKKYSPELDQALKYIIKGIKNNSIKKMYTNTLEDSVSGTRYQIYRYSEVYKFRKKGFDDWTKFEDYKPKMYTLYKLRKCLLSVGID